jgi:SET domain-containing protein
MSIKHNWLNPGLEVRNSKIGGRGVFAKENIIRGTRLAIFGGKLMFIDEIRNLPENLQEYTMQIEERLILGPPQNSTEPDETDFFNHSCEPNSGFKGQLFLVAMRDITKNEEITFDYAMVVSESVGSDFVFEMECKCGSGNCRKKITEYDWKLPELQKKYYGFFSQYLQEKCSYGNNSEI